MRDSGRVGIVTAPMASAPVFVGTFAVLLVLIVAFLVLDTTLARIDRRESALHAADLYQEGRMLLGRDDAHEASDRFASALAMERGNTTYALGLAQAMMADGRSDDAEQTLRDLLDRAENDGSVNLLMARLLARAGRTGEAVAYYHRAIFGRWGADSTQQRTNARFELVDLLATRNDEGAMLAELLPLEATFPDSSTVRRRLAHLFLRAGSPRRSIAIFREFLRTNPSDGDAYAGMGEAALALGNFSTARADLAEAVRLRPDDARLPERFALADTILALDPEVRGMAAPERVARARALLTRALGERQACAGTRDVGALANSARSRLATPAGPPTAASADATTRLAMKLWSTRPTRCAAGFAPDEALALLFGSREL